MASEIRKVLHITAEMSPFAKVGGLADVCEALAKYLNRENIDSRVIMPLHSTVKQEVICQLKPITEMAISIANKNIKAEIKQLVFNNTIVYFIDCPYYFERGHRIYGYEDEMERFIFFTKVVLETFPKLNFIPNVLHYHDWHMGYLPVYLNEYKYQFPDIYCNISTVLTIHNFGYQGIFSYKENFHLLQLGKDKFERLNLDFYGQINFLKAGIEHSDIVNTVSATHALELLDEAKNLNIVPKRPIYGILNALDLEKFNPNTDVNLYKEYGMHDCLIGKRYNKQMLQRELGLEVNASTPIVTMVARFTREKGFNLLSYVYKHIINEGIQLILMGDGEEYYENLFSDVSKNFIGKMCIMRYNENLVSKIYAGSDFFLMPSHYEPCGTTQLISMRYGTIPIVRKTGGLADTVIDCSSNSKGTGFVFEQLNEWVMLNTISKAINFYKDATEEEWQQIIENAMQYPTSWKETILSYIDLYKEAVTICSKKHNYSKI